MNIQPRSQLLSIYLYENQENTIPCGDIILDIPAVKDAEVEEVEASFLHNKVEEDKEIEKTDSIKVAQMTKIVKSW